MFDQPPDLSPDLDWILNSNQVSEKILVETLVRDHFNGLRQFALIVLDDDSLASQVATEVIVMAVSQRDTYWGDTSGRCWLFLHAWRNCSKKLSSGFGSMLRQIITHRHSTYPKDDRILLEKQLEVESWRVIDDLDDRSRIAFLLNVLFHFETDEIAVILGESESNIQVRLRKTIDQFHNHVDPPTQDEWSLDDLMVKPLERRWQVEGQTENQIEEVILRVRHSLDGIDQKSQLRSSFHKLSVGVLAIVLVVLILWFTNVSATRETRPPFISEKIIITRVVRITVYVTAEPEAAITPEPILITPGVGENQGDLPDSKFLY